MGILKIRILFKTGSISELLKVALAGGDITLYQGQGLEFDMKYHILHDFKTTSPFKEKSSDHFKDFWEELYKLCLKCVILNSSWG